MSETLKIDISSAEVVPVNDMSSPASVVDSLYSYFSIDSYPDTEQMLEIGSKILSACQSMYNYSIIRFGQPIKEACDYVVKSYPPSDLVSVLKDKENLQKATPLLVGAGSLTVVYFLARKLQGKYQDIQKRSKEQRDEERTRDEIMQQKRAAATGRLNRNSAKKGDHRTCILCVSNPRECVFLDCGHICTCVDCLEALPFPKVCPICQSKIIQIVPLFLA